MIYNPFKTEKAKINTESRIATIAAVYDDGATLYIDGETTPTRKHYKTRKEMVLRSGDKVKIIHISGTYIVDCIIGNPIKGG